MKNNTHNEFQSIDNQHYKKKYIMRKIQDEEAKRQIKETWQEVEEDDSKIPADYKSVDM